VDDVDPVSVVLASFAFQRLKSPDRNWTGPRCMFLSTTARAHPHLPSALVRVARARSGPTQARPRFVDRVARRHAASSTYFLPLSRAPLLLASCARAPMEDSPIRQRRTASSQPGSGPDHDEHSHVHEPAAEHSHSHSHSHSIFGHSHSHDDGSDQTAEEVMKALQGSGTLPSPVAFAVVDPAARRPRQPHNAHRAVRQHRSDRVQGRRRLVHEFGRAPRRRRPLLFWSAARRV
jgi:hypothetical protein